MTAGVHYLYFAFAESSDVLVTYLGAFLYTRTAIISPARTHISAYACYIFDGFISLRNSYNRGLGETRGMNKKEKRMRSNCKEEEGGKEGNGGKRDEKNTHTEGKGMVTGGQGI